MALLSGSMNGMAQGAGASNANGEIRIQVCVSTQRIYFDDVRLERLENHPQFTQYSEQQLELAPKTIRRVARSSDPRVTGDPRAIRYYGIAFGEVLNRSGLYSHGSEFMPLRDSTTADQPVYERGYGHPASDYVAVHVRVPEANMAQGEKSPTYWFKLPGTIPADGFSQWFAPASMESASTSGSSPIWYRLTHGGDLPIYPVAADAPKIRVALLTQKPVHNDPSTDFLPALTTARLRLRTATSGPQFNYEFVPKTNEVIPRCD